MTTAATLRDQGHEQATLAADPRHILTIDAAIADANASGQPWTADCIRSRVPVVSRGLVGARVRAAAMRQPVEMVAVGWQKSTHPATRCAVIRVWRGVA